MRNYRVTVIGGGTGSFVVLRGLKNYPVDLTAIINVTDSGGSTGRLSSEFGFLPVGDLRQCLAALADDGDEALLKLLTYRFNRGRGLEGHNLGNLILTGLRDIYGSEPKALEQAVSIFRLSGQILPVSLYRTNLCAIYEGGRKLVGEHAIDEPEFGGGKHISKIFISPSVKVYSKATNAIVESDLIVLGPGDIYTSTLPCLLVDGVKQALKKSKAKLVYVVNLMNRYSQTHNFKVSDYVKEIEKYSGRSPQYVVLNTSKIPSKITDAYMVEKATLPLDDLGNPPRMEVIRGDFAKRSIFRKAAGDKLVRSFFRHHEERLAKALIKILL